MRLAQEGPSLEYLNAAVDIFAAPSDRVKEALPAMTNSPRFMQALARQGIELEELGLHSTLSIDRRTTLLATVLQEWDLLKIVQTRPAKGARALRDQMLRRLSESLERAHRQQEHRHAVHERHESLLEERRQHQERDAHLEENRAGRVRDRDHELLQCRRECSLSREKHCRATYLAAEDLERRRRADRQAAIDAQEARARQCLSRREEDRDRQLQRLQEHSQAVQDTARLAKQAEMLRCQNHSRRLQKANQKSEERLRSVQHCRELSREHRGSKELEYEHQVVRIARMKRHECDRKHVEVLEDMAIFTECQKIMDSARHLRDPAALGSHLAKLGYLSGDWSHSASGSDHPGQRRQSARSSWSGELNRLQTSLSEPMMLRDALTHGRAGVVRMLRRQRLDQERMEVHTPTDEGAEVPTAADATEHQASSPASLRPPWSAGGTGELAGSWGSVSTEG